MMVTREYPYCPPSEARRYGRTVPHHHHSPYSMTYPDRSRFQLPTHDPNPSRQNMSEETETTPTRKRIAVACGRCRKRKIKCSGDPGHGQPCTNCKSAGVDQCLFLRVQSTETTLRTDHSGPASFSYGLDTARRYHSGPTASPLAYDTPAAIPDMMGYRGYYPKHSADHQAPPYYGITGPPATWASSMSPTYVDEGHSEVGVDYSALPTHYTNPMMPLYGTAPSGRWAGSKSAGGQLYVTESPYSPVYPPTSATPSSTAEITTVSRADAYATQGPFPGMGRMAASLPNPAGLVDGSKMGAMLPTPASNASARTPLPSSPSSYRMPHSGQITDGLQHSSSPIDSPGASQYCEYPAQSSGLASTGTPVSATRSTLPGNGSAMNITSTSTGGTDSSLYSSHTATERESDDTYSGSHIFRHDQDLKSQSSSGELGYTYGPPLAGSGDSGSAPVGYYEAPSVDMTTPVPATDRDGPRAGLRA